MEPSMDIAVVKKLIALDHRIADEVIVIAQEEFPGLYSNATPLGIDLFGKNQKANADALSFRRERNQFLRKIFEDLYCQRISVSGGMDVHYLVGKERNPGGGALCGDDWSLISWTAPIAEHLMNAQAGDSYSFRNLRYQIETRAEFGTVLPKITDTTYFTRERSYFVKHEDEVLTQVSVELAAEAPEQEYQATQTYGLGEIIELADHTQRAAMFLPFGKSVLIEGPPGSGKTSIGLMRIPCLIDQQWEALGRKLGEDAPYHKNSTMQVLVMNEEMVPYLEKLTASIGISGISVKTVAKFYQQLCSRSGIPGGELTEESRVLAAIKSHPAVLKAYWAGFGDFAHAHWARVSAKAMKTFKKIDPVAGPSLHKMLETWVRQVSRGNLPEDCQQLNLTHRFREWDEAQQNSRSAVTKLRGRYKTLAKKMLNRHAIVKHMVKTPAFDRLCEHVDKEAVATEWLGQGKKKKISSADLALQAWMSAQLLLINPKPPKESKPPIGNFRELITHIVIDEAQDISCVDAANFQCLLDAAGTMTLVGDLRQRIVGDGSFSAWEDLEVRNLCHALFNVNHRQSQPLGRYVHLLHNDLYGAPPKWQPSQRTQAPKPRVSLFKSASDLAAQAIREVNHWRGEITGATVAVLYAGPADGMLEEISQRVKGAMGENYTDVKFNPSASAAHLQQIDCVLISGVLETKGLEFDAVVVIDPHRVWAKPIHAMSTVEKNLFYVAASRAKQGLSLILHEDDGIHRSNDMRNVCLHIGSS